MACSIWFDMTTLDKAIGTTDGASLLAAALGVTVQRLWNWRARGVPAEFCPAIEHATAGEVTCEELRSDVAWVRVADVSWPHPDGRPLVDHNKFTFAKTCEGKAA